MAQRNHDPAACGVYTKRLHGLMFEWDENKRQRVLFSRGIDFIDAIRLFDGPPIRDVPSMREGEPRVASTAEFSGKFYTVIWTWRNENRRIISFRRARRGEERAYRQIFG